jgi:hypothetical protein
MASGAHQRADRLIPLVAVVGGLRSLQLRAFSAESCLNSRQPIGFEVVR